MVHADAVEATLRDQEERGQVISYDEADARRLLGASLKVAALGAVPKGASSDGAVEVRVVHDGTHGVEVNHRIRVLDTVLCPMAADVQMMLREQAASGVPHYLLTADVKEARTAVAVRPDD